MLKVAVLRIPYVKIIIAVYALLVSIACIKFTKYQPTDKEIMKLTSNLDSAYSMRYRRAYYQGIQNAQKEIKQSKMTIYTAGFISPHSNNFDEETGLPMKIIAGCIISDSIDGLIQGHNDIIRKCFISDEEMRATNHLEPDISIGYRKAYYQGMQEAYTEIKNNKITRYVYGKGNWGATDKETGIPIKVIAGCIVPDSILVRVKGHNYIILKYLNHEIR